MTQTWGLREREIRGPMFLAWATGRINIVTTFCDEEGCEGKYLGAL